MKTYKKKTVKTVDQIYCDCCGESCTKTEPFTEHECATIEAKWGYMSKQDGTYYDIEICESCFMELLHFIKQKRKNILGSFNYPHDHDPLKGYRFPS